MLNLLSGVKILDLTHFLSGPYCTMLIADLGGDVIKIENPNKPDSARNVPPHFIEEESVYFLSLNRGKKSVTIDLTTDEGLKQFYQLVKDADVVIDNFRPGVTSRLKIDYDILKTIKPDIITCSISGFGYTGPYRDQPAYDYIIQALTGVMSLTGEPNGLPTKTGISMVDHVGGLFAAFSIASALLHRERTGEGVPLDVSLMDSQLSMLTYLAANYLNAGDIAKRIPESGHPSIVPAQNFPTKDGFITIAAMNDKFWKILCDVLELWDLGNDENLKEMKSRMENKEYIITRIKQRLITNTTDYWADLLIEAGVPCAPVLTIDKALQHQQVLARNMVIEMDHPTCGKVKAIGNPIKLKGKAGDEKFTPAPLLGQHNGIFC
ncbi:CaiB/BaiF CoA transferase family protein [Anaerobacillus sp. MEB173]|uniref:CaiB/BaiF CoA transferase family protein n=1 Tax=Anaerobacillus sp. MEB173 TaxID=3383345 RepID=UPI003F919628